MEVYSDHIPGHQCKGIKSATACINVTGYKGTATRIVAYMYIQQLSGGNWITLDSHRYEFQQLAWF